MTETDVRSQTAAVIPAYQDEKHIGDIVSRTRQQLDHVLVIDDGSTDQTAQRAREAGADVIVHDQNRGKGEAIKTGLAHWFAAANPSGGGHVAGWPRGRPLRETPSASLRASAGNLSRHVFNA